MKKGFSLFELIISVSILGILTAIAINTFHTSQLKKEQDGITQSIVAQLEKQKADTQAGKNGSNYGIKFNANSYVLYKGAVYSINSTTNQSVPIDDKFLLEETIVNVNNVINFSRLYGEANETATLTISHIQNQITPQVILIEKSGTISVLE